MRFYAFSCVNCGSANIRRSRRKSASEFAEMLLGRYPFRCLDCNQRFWVNVWIFSTLPFAKCPRCLSIRITDTPKHHRLRVWKKLLITFGAHAYRCSVCRHDFVSFRRAEADGKWDASAMSGAEAVPQGKTGA